MLVPRQNHNQFHFRGIPEGVLILFTLINRVAAFRFLSNELELEKNSKNICKTAMTSSSGYVY